MAQEGAREVIERLTLSPDVGLDEVEIEHLSPRLREFVDLIGLKATMQLVQAFGGRRLYVPIKPKADHHLARLIGLEALKKLSAVYGIENHFLIPKADRALRQARHRRIRAQYGLKSASQLADEYQMSERQIWGIVARKDNNDRSAKASPAGEKQQQLFD